MRIGIVSDTHAQVHSAQNAARMLESLDVEQVLHCGDIGSTAVVDVFSPWITHYVFGNVDLQQQTELAAAIERCKGVCHGRFGSLELAGRRVALLHGDDGARLAQALDADWDLVCHGHTHVTRNERRGRTLVLNPGALHRARQHTLACVELSDLAVTFVAV